MPRAKVVALTGSAGILRGFYARLAALGCVRCPRCRSYTSDVSLHACDFLTAPVLVSVVVARVEQREAA